jgi:hypothetical protein
MSTKTATIRCEFCSKAGARKLQSCQRTTGSEIAIAAMKTTLTVVKNGSVTPNVTSSPSRASGSGWASQRRMSSLKMYAPANATTTAMIETIRRERNSSRCSTSVTLSSCFRRRGSRAMAGG